MGNPGTGQTTDGERRKTTGRAEQTYQNKTTIPVEDTAQNLVVGPCRAVYSGGRRPQLTVEKQYVKIPKRNDQKRQDHRSILTEVRRHRVGGADGARHTHRAHGTPQPPRH